MKKSTLNVITLALVLINLALTVILTFSLVSTNNKTNKLIVEVVSLKENLVLLLLAVDVVVHQQPFQKIPEYIVILQDFVVNWIKATAFAT